MKNFKNIQQKINNLKYYYDYDEYIEFINSIKKRKGKDLTGTPCDFFTDEEIKSLNAKGVEDLTPYIPIPKEIQELKEFTLQAHRELRNKYPNDKWIKFLGSEEGIKYLCNTNWFEEYGYNLMY